MKKRLFFKFGFKKTLIKKEVESQRIQLLNASQEKECVAKEVTTLPPKRKHGTQKLLTIITL
jgi:hypothetical protein